MGRLSLLDEGAIKVIIFAYGRGAGARIRRLKVTALAATSTRSLPDALKTRNPHEGNIVVVFLECGCKCMDTCRERVREVRVENV